MVIKVGHSLDSELRLTQREIAEGADYVGDRNPMHYSPSHGSTRIEGMIASGSHVAARFSALIPTHFIKYGEVLGLEMSFAFRSPVRAQTRYRMQWRVERVAWSSKLDAQILTLEGTVRAPDGEIQIEGNARVALIRHSSES